MSAFDKITAQQEGKEGTDIWMVGQQLKDILREDPSLEEIVDTDLEVKEMSLKHCAGKIKEYADELHRKQKGSCVCVTPDVAEGIIRKFYGLPDMAGTDPEPAPTPAAVPVVEEEDVFDFSAFL